MLDVDGMLNYFCLQSSTNLRLLPSMVAGKVKPAMGIQKDSPVPLLEVPKNVLVSINKQSSANNSLQKSKVRASEYSSRVKRSLIGYLPKAAQVQPRGSSECNCTKRDVAALGQLVKELQERETQLQKELAEYKVLKETMSRVPLLERELKMKNVEAEGLIKRIGLLEAEKNQMCEEIASVPALKMEMEAAKAKIEELRKEHDGNTEKKMQTEFEIEIMELRRLNLELQEQSREMASKLATAESQIVALSNITESDLVAKTETEESRLRHTNEDLRKQVEGLQMNRFSEVEELAHLRWVNASLRYELSNSKLPSGKRSAEDLNDCLSPKSQHIAKQLMLECAVPKVPVQPGKRQAECDSEYLLSHSSNTSETGDLDDLSLENFQGLRDISKRSSLTGKMKKSTKTKDVWQFLQNEYFIDRGSETSHSGNSTPRHRHSRSSSKESLEQLMLQNRREAFELKQLENGDTSKVTPDCTDFQLKKCDQPKGSNKSLLLKTNIVELQNSISASSQLTPRKIQGDLDEKNPAFKGSQQISLQKGDQPTADKQVTRTKCSDVTKLTPAEVEKRALRIPKPPPKPSSDGALTNGPANGVRSIPPPPPPPPQRQGLKGAPPPPPPPPPPKSVATGASVMQRAPEVVEFYHSLMKRDAKKDSSGAGLADTPDVANARSSMIGEIENRSSHLLAIKTDVETQGDFVRSLIREVRAAAYTNIEDVVAFVKWLDDELSFLVDERAVLKHFDWPERKADAMREAAFGYCDLKKLESEVSSYKDDLRQPCDVALKKMLALLEKLEHSVYSLLRMRDAAMARYKEFQIPRDWMLDSGIVSKIKFASVKLAKKYMKRVAIELESMGSSEKEFTQEFLMLQGVRFAFRVHQFAGGFDAESMCAFEQLRNLCHKESLERRQYAGLPAC
eukprot:Gb_08786 [translate_table: standard]